MSQHLARHLFARVVLVWLCLPLVPAYADAPAGVPWQMLEFERKSIWGTANSRIELQVKSSAEVAGDWQNPGPRDYLMPAAGLVWKLSVATALGSSNQARLQLLLEPASAAIYQRDRLTIGRKDRRDKFYRYHREGVTRIRRDPQPGEANLPPAQWSKSSVQEISFPRLPTGSVVTTPFALLILVSSTPLAAAGSAEFFLHTDFNLYRVVLRRGADTRIKANYLLYGGDGKSRRYKEDRLVETIHLQVEPTAQAPGKPDFELLGLRGEVTVFKDSETRLPLSVSGTAPRIGKARLDLKSAALPETAPQ